MLSTILGGELVQSLTWVGDMALLVVKNNDIYFLVSQLRKTITFKNYFCSQIFPKMTQFASLILGVKG